MSSLSGNFSKLKANNGWVDSISVNSSLMGLFKQSNNEVEREDWNASTSEASNSFFANILNGYKSKKSDQDKQYKAVDQYDEESSGLISNTIGTIKSNFTDGIAKSANQLIGLTKKMQEVQTAAENWKNFAILFFLGIFFIFLSFLFLPVFVIIPSKFAGLFTIGSICILSSVAVMKGTKEFFTAITQTDKLLYSVSYIATITGTLYFSIFKKTYFMALIFSISQILSLGFFVSMNFPGGTKGMKFVVKKLFESVKNLCCMFFK